MAEDNERDWYKDDEYFAPDDADDYDAWDYEMGMHDPDDCDDLKDLAEEYLEEGEDGDEEYDEVWLWEQEQDELEREAYEQAMLDEPCEYESYSDSCITCALRKRHAAGIETLNSVAAQQHIGWLVQSDFAAPIPPWTGPWEGNYSDCEFCGHNAYHPDRVKAWRIVRDGQVVARTLYSGGPCATVGVISWLFCRGYVDKCIDGMYVALFPNGCGHVPAQAALVVPMADILGLIEYKEASEKPKKEVARSDEWGDDIPF